MPRNLARAQLCATSTSSKSVDLPERMNLNVTAVLVREPDASAVPEVSVAEMATDGNSLPCQGYG